MSHGFEYRSARAGALLGANESPFAPPAWIRMSVCREAGRLNRYPDPDCRRLRDALARQHDVPADHVVVGNGAAELLFALGSAVTDGDANYVFAWPSYYLYPRLAALRGAEPRAVPLDRDERHDLEAMLAAVDSRTRLLLVCDPNNPTGTAVPPAMLVHAVDRSPPGAVVALDEAYCEFNPNGQARRSIGLLGRGKDVVLLRTFSKAYGLAGARVGYALCSSRELAARLEAVRPPFAVGSTGQSAALAALGRQAEIEQRIARLERTREALTAGLLDLGLAPADSVANFAWTRLPETLADQDVVERLAARRVFVAAGSELCGINGLRITCGTPQERSRTLSALPAAMEEARG
jgi:histidinol-phosphate aminotransferase